MVWEADMSSSYVLHLEEDGRHRYSVREVAALSLTGLQWCLSLVFFGFSIRPANISNVNNSKRSLAHCTVHSICFQLLVGQKSFATCLDKIDRIARYYTQCSSQLLTIHQEPRIYFDHFSQAEIIVIQALRFTTCLI